MEKITDDVIKKEARPVADRAIKIIDAKQERVDHNRGGKICHVRINLAKDYFALADKLLVDQELDMEIKPFSQIIQDLTPRFDKIIENLVRDCSANNYSSGLIVRDGMLFCQVGSLSDAWYSWGMSGEIEINSSDIRAFFDGTWLALTDNLDKRDPLCVAVKRNGEKSYTTKLVIKNGVKVGDKQPDGIVDQNQLSFVASAMATINGYINNLEY